MGLYQREATSTPSTVIKRAQSALFCQQLNYNDLIVHFLIIHASFHLPSLGHLQWTALTKVSGAADMNPLLWQASSQIGAPRHNCNLEEKVLGVTRQRLLGKLLINALLMVTFIQPSRIRKYVYD